MKNLRFDVNGEPVIVQKDSKGVGYCIEDCPQHDGKRCRILGMRPSSICEPWAWMILELLDAYQIKQP